ncbi:MAG: prephenate dehydrogenase/arogenate dehydrogenase family protein, partial [Clostridiales bacterium]|nr:prephenate dehydrogenase/arogenate dehydrogenase family protein [Clostridiales bacterium]
MNIGIIGLGLMGASFGKAFKKAGHTVYGFDTDRETMLKSELVGAADAPLSGAEYGELDVLMIALNPRAFYGVATLAAPQLRAGAAVLDIGGNKRAVVAAMRKLAALYPDLNFIATHPMAGREYSGINHSSAAMFENASALMIPVCASIEAAAAVKKLFLEIGFFRVLPSDAETHDRIIAYTSQLCHILSSS